mgnify:CR=1 FL=1
MNGVHRDTVASLALENTVHSSAVRAVNALAQLVFPVALVSVAYDSSSSSIARRYCTNKR